jgi:hypothetical protein
LTQTYIFSAVALITGFVVAWIMRTISMSKLQKSLKSTQGYLESALLKKETLQKENIQVHQLKQSSEMECKKPKRCWNRASLQCTHLNYSYWRLKTPSHVISQCNSKLEKMPDNLIANTGRIVNCQ